MGYGQDDAFYLFRLALVVADDNFTFTVRAKVGDDFLSSNFIHAFNQAMSQSYG